MSQKYRRQSAEALGGLMFEPLGERTFSAAAGAPTNSIAGYAIGGIYVDQTNAVAYINTGTAASSTFTAFPVSGSTLAALTVTVLTAPTANIGTLTVAATTTTPAVISDGDGSTALTPKVQVLGANKGAASQLLASFSATSTSAVAPSVDFLKSANATVGSNTVVVSGEVLGEINWFGADGTDFKSAAARIACLVDTTPGTGDMPGRLVFSTTTDNTEVLSEAFRIDNAQRLIAGGVAAQTVGGVIGSEQVWGTTAAKSQAVLGCASTTDATMAEFAFVKGGNAAVGSFTTVASAENLGCITWYGDNGTDYSLAFARISAVVDATPGAADAPGRVVIWTTPDGSTSLTEAARFDNAQRLVVGGVAAQTVSSGDGATASIPRAQVWGTTQATGTLLVGCANTTDSISGGVAIVKSGNAAVGSFTVVASGESLGTITWFGDNGTDYLSPAGKIEMLVDATPGAADMPGRMIFSVTADGAETMTERLRITNAGILTTFAAAPSNINAAGTIMPSGGVAITDVLNAWIDDSTHGSGTVAHLIGNQTITTSSDSRIKKNIMPFDGALAAVERAPRVVSFEYDHPNWGGDRAAPDDEDARKWGPNARGRYVGFIAQETKEWAPWVVNAGAGEHCPKCQKGETCDDPTHPFWAVEYQHLVPMLVAAVKELHAKVKKLEAA